MGSKTTIAPPSPEEKAYLASQQQLAAKQLELLGTQGDFQKQYLESVKPLLDQQLAQANDPVQKEINQRTSAYQLQQLQDQADLAPLQKQLAQAQLDAALRGPNATPEQAAQIDAATKGALQSGTSDINQFSQDAERQLAQNLAPGLGLRPTDTPIVDRGQLVAQEATRQVGQLTSNLSTANANAKLNYPLAASQVSSAAGQAQQGLGLAAQQFQAQLADAAVQNRMSLLGNGMSAGTGLVGASRPNSLTFNRGSKTSDPSRVIIGIAAGLGNAMAGSNASPSDKRVKNIIATAGYDRKGREWKHFTYKNDPAKTHHIGLIAQEVEKTDPHAVFTSGLGLKYVDYSKLAA